MSKLQEKILSFDESRLALLRQIIDENKLNHVERAKFLSSKDIVLSMQRQFIEILASNEKYRDPTRILESVIDDNGQKIPIYEQNDIGDFFLNFLNRL